MKKLFAIFFLILSVNAFATIEASEELAKVPDAAEVEKNRACFKELEGFGCGDPGEDVERFRICLNNVYSQLPKRCRSMMSDLYSSR